MVQVTFLSTLFGQESLETSWKAQTPSSTQQCLGVLIGIKLLVGVTLDFDQLHNKSCKNLECKLPPSCINTQYSLR